MAKPNKKKSESFVKDTLNKKKSETTTSQDNFKVSFQYLDTTQKYGSSFRDWQSVGLLSKALEVLQGYCCSPLLEQINGDKFAKYGNFPPTDKTKFIHPKHVPEDACWARIHITGPAVLAGHILGDTFYVVFLDKTHKFYLTRRVTEN